MDNGAAGRTALPAYVLDDATSYALSEVRGTRGGTVTWLAMSGSNTTTVSVSALSGDASGALTLGARVMALLASQPVSIMPGVSEAELPVVNAVSSASSLWSVTQRREYTQDQSAFSFAGMGINVAVNATLVVPPAVSVVGATLSVSGVLQGAYDVSVGSDGSVVFTSTCS
ncbi:MAG: hypothetical protein EOP52_14275, partial [Sphingobacteriales bacterium]